MPDRVEIVRRAYERFSAGDHAGLLALCTPDVEMDETAVFPDGNAQSYDEWEAETEERWDRLRVAPQDFQEVGDCVIATGEARMLGRRSGAPVAQRFVMAFHFEADRIRRIVGYASVEDAAADVVDAARRRSRRPG